MKAALDYCRRMNIEPFVRSGYSGSWSTNANKARNDLADLAEQINALKSVGAI